MVLTLKTRVSADTRSGADEQTKGPRRARADSGSNDRVGTVSAGTTSGPWVRTEHERSAAASGVAQTIEPRSFDEQTTQVLAAIATARASRARRQGRAKNRTRTQRGNERSGVDGRTKGLQSARADGVSNVCDSTGVALALTGPWVKRSASATCALVERRSLRRKSLQRARTILLRTVSVVVVRIGGRLIGRRRRRRIDRQRRRGSGRR